MGFGHRERGSATVWAAVWALLPVCLACVVLAFGAAAAARHRAAVAADGAALAAAAQADAGQGPACAAARRIAAAQGAVLVSCTVRSGFADVVAETRMPLLAGQSRVSRVPARAGPG
ncbi:Rv3654c family TadE-like protein [Yinghuangia soli]|uniref:Pilus assembly protein TadG-related protein n=1 Tax=Yinghuangia soli TaxID=2908204 RepID=A0AA41Q0H8_9ACTN|nr:Rv3654c family TadE-like protein [Yinghuangia soli]MCF2529233.1 pilus assembly protein TadG-related protein [Yinghuangia soli]